MNKNKLSTLDIPTEINSYGSDGNTTRLIDNAIQIIFKGHICVCHDHHKNGSDKMSNVVLMEKIVRRLKIEHDITSADLVINYGKFEISFNTDLK